MQFCNGLFAIFFLLRFLAYVSPMLAQYFYSSGSLLTTLVCALVTAKNWPFPRKKLLIIEQNDGLFENLLWNFDLIITENEMSIYSDNKIVMYLKVTAVLLSIKMKWKYPKRVGLPTSYLHKGIQQNIFFLAKKLLDRFFFFIQAKIEMFKQSIGFTNSIVEKVN